MNEQIDKLLVEAGAHFGGDGVVYDTFNPKKFAELIINKCLTICEELGDKGMDGHYCADAISKTFRS